MKDMMHYDNACIAILLCTVNIIKLILHKLLFFHHIFFHFYDHFGRFNFFRIQFWFLQKTLKFIFSKILILSNFDYNFVHLIILKYIDSINIYYICDKVFSFGLCIRKCALKCREAKNRFSQNSHSKAFSSRWYFLCSLSFRLLN